MFLHARHVCNTVEGHVVQYNEHAQEDDAY